MTAATRARRPAPAPSAPRRSGLAALRLLRLELRHNAMAWLLPVVIALFWLTTCRKTMAMPPLWNVRAAGLQSGALLDVAIPVTGAAAWTASREGRRRVTDQVSVTARPRWARLLAPWAATTIWALAGYLGCLAVLYGVTTHQASWGGPLWWPAAVVAASVPAFSALGFAAGTFLPSRFTAPLAAIAAFFALALSTQLIVGSHSYWQVSPVVTGPWDLGAQPGVATFYPFEPDLSIAQVMFLAGFTAALLGALALPAGPGGSASRRLRAGAAVLTAAGLLAAGTAAKLAGTGTMDAHGMIAIPALHDAASDRPIRYTPVCRATVIPVCLNPAYASYLTPTAHALAPLLGQLAGLPGAPARIVQVAVTYQQHPGNDVSVAQADPPPSGSPPSGSRPSGSRPSDSQVGGALPVFRLILPDQLPEPAMTPGQLASQVVTTYGPALLARVVGDGQPGASPAQNAVATGLMIAAGLRKLDVEPTPSGQRPAPGGPDASQSPGVAPGTPAYAAAERFAALPEPARHAWLVAHLVALRAGQITLAQLP